MHAVLEQMKSVKVDRATGVTVRGGVWQEWLRQWDVDIQPALDRDRAAREASAAEVAPVRTRRSA